MIVAIPRETYPGERRVALVPASVPPLVKAGYKVLIEAGAGVAAGHPDQAYAAKGAEVVASRQDLFAKAKIILQVRTYGANQEAGKADLGLLAPGQILIGMAEPLSNAAAMQAIAERKATLFALELIPRITRAQVMDVLSSMAMIAGYRAVLLGAISLPKIFPMMSTAAGPLTPARVLVLGVGVAGLMAIATARKLGATVQAFDVRSAVKEQVLSLGAKFVEVQLDTSVAEGKGGYAQEQSEDFLRKQRELLAKVVADSDLVITTAAVPGKKAPVLVTRAMVEGMQPGAVVFDMAAERGGNCELTRVDEVVVEKGVTILGPSNLASGVPAHSSQLYSKNVYNFLTYLVKPDANKQLQVVLNREDEIIRDTLVTHDGAVVHPAVAGAPSPVAAGA